MEKSLEEQAAVERGPIPPLKSSSGQQKAGEDGAFVLLRRAWFDLNISYKKEGGWATRGVCLRYQRNQR